MRNKSAFFGVVFLSLVVLSVSVVAEIYPNRFFGSITVNGIPVQDGLTVTIIVNDIEFTAFSEGGRYRYDVLSDDPSTPEVEGGEDGDIVEFYFGGVKANEEAIFESGEFTPVDLTLPSQEESSSSYNSTDRMIIATGPDTVLEITTNDDVNDTVINISKSDDTFLGDIALGDAYSYLKSISIEMDESVIEYVIIKMYYTDDEIAGMDENSLLLYHYNETSGEWELIPNQGVNADDNYVWANVTHLSTYGLFGQEQLPSLPPEEGGGPGPGGGGPTCTPNWTCTEWSSCSPNGTQTRTCTDANNCGTTANKPAETETCTYTPLQLPAICNPGVRVCAGNDLMQCSEGNNWVKVETCEYGCSDNKCSPAPTPTAEANITVPTGGMPTGLVFGVEPSLLAGIMGVIVILAGLVYWSRIRKPKITS